VALSFRDTQANLKALQHLPKKSLGQNFLIDANIVEKQLQLAELIEGERMVEVGPGLGTLTQTALEKGAKVFAVELDKWLADHLEAKLRPLFPKHFNLCRADAMKKPLGDLPAHIKPNDPFKIVANLPYAISTPWLAAILNQPFLPTKMVLMLQRETADRFVAQEKLAHRGPISIFLQSAFEKNRLYPVHRQSFYPKPKVESCLLVLDRKPEPYRFHVDTQKLIQQFFTKRRKQMGHLIRKSEAHIAALADWQKVLESDNLSLTLRPEAIPFETWQALDQAVRNHHI
jgi:16S rRNA (adenine1518-N6/adenine1519-N6)-dimethyltransferase